MFVLMWPAEKNVKYFDIFADARVFQKAVELFSLSYSKSGFYPCLCFFFKQAMLETGPPTKSGELPC